MKQSIILLILLNLSTAAFCQTTETREVSNFTKVAFKVPGKLNLTQGNEFKVTIKGDKEVLSEIETIVEGGRLIVQRKSKFGWGRDDSDDILVEVTMKEIEAISVAGSGDLTCKTKISAKDLDLSVSGSGSLTGEIQATGEVEANVSGSGEIDLTGKCKDLESDISGSGKVILALTIENEADFEISGSGRVEAKGSAAIVKTTISGSGRVDGADLETKKCVVQISGSGGVQIHAKEEINATISGSGEVAYRGNPSKVNSNSSGSGKVRKL